MNKPILIIVFSYLLVINVIAFFLYKIDKKNARRGKTRIPSSVLLWMARLGGGLGAWFSMSYYHHKKNHDNFKRLVPLWIFIWLFIVVILIIVCSGSLWEDFKTMFSSGRMY